MDELPDGVSINSLFRIQRLAREKNMNVAAAEAAKVGVRLSFALAYRYNIRTKKPGVQRPRVVHVQAPAPVVERDGWIGESVEDQTPVKSNLLSARVENQQPPKPAKKQVAINHRHKRPPKPVKTKQELPVPAPISSMDRSSFLEKVVDATAATAVCTEAS